MKQICAHVDTMGEAVTALESDENGDFFRYVVSERTRAHEQAEGARHSATIKVMKDDRALGLGRMYGPDCYGGSPGWWRFHTRQSIANAV